MAEAVALVSIATTGAVAVTVPLIAGWMEERRARRRLAAERFDELRAVLDAAALALDGVAYEIGGTSSIVDLDEPTPDQELAQLKKLEQALGRLNEQKRRVALRLGESAPLYCTLDAAHGEGWVAWNTMTEVIFHELEFDASRRRLVDASIERLAVLVSEFTSLASARIGPTATTY